MVPCMSNAVFSAGEGTPWLWAAHAHSGSPCSAAHCGAAAGWAPPSVRASMRLLTPPRESYETELILKSML